MPPRRGLMNIIEAFNVEYKVREYIKSICKFFILGCGDG
jgi:hypothetical protein